MEVLLLKLYRVLIASYVKSKHLIVPSQALEDKVPS